MQLMQGRTDPETGRTILDAWFLTIPSGIMLEVDNTYWWPSKAEAIEAGKRYLLEYPDVQAIYVNRHCAAISLRMQPDVEEFE